MNTKLLWFALALLFFLPATLEAKKKRVNKTFQKSYPIITRVPMDFDFTVEDTDGVLQIVFIGSLYEADVVVTDKNGTVVWEETSTSIYEGKTVCIPNADDYPYALEITSPVMDVSGEITLEED